MKANRILLILIASLTIMVVTVLVSFTLEARSQKLPAVVKVEKVMVCSRVEGVVDSYAVLEMDQVSNNSEIAYLSNDELQYRLEALLQEKRRYEELIASARNGDALDLELMDIEEKIQRYLLDKDEYEADLRLICANSGAIRQRYNVAGKSYQAQSEMFENGIIGSSEYSRASEGFRKLQDDYQELVSDSLLAVNSLRNLDTIISALNTRKLILRSNEDILASKYLLELDKLNIEIFDLEQEISALSIVSNVNGIITDIPKRPGEEVDEGDVVAEITNLKNIWITAYGNSSSARRIQPGNKVVIYSNSGEKLTGSVRSVSPVMEKVKSLSNSYETENTYTKIEIDFDDMTTALHHVAPGERLFVRALY